MAIDRVGERARAETLNREQFEVFYARTAPALRSYISRVAANSTLADDLLHESYIRLLNAPAMLEGQRKSYLYRTATNLITDYHRSQARRRRWWDLFPRRQEAADSQVELSSDMERLFSQVSDRDRALLWLAYVE